MDNHLYSLFNSHRNLRLLILIGAVFSISFFAASDANAQRRGYNSGYSRPPPVYRQQPMQRPRPSVGPGTPRQGQSPYGGSRGTGPSGSRGQKALPPSITPNSSVAASPLYKGQVTKAGKPIIQANGTNYQISQQGVISTRAKLIAGAGAGVFAPGWDDQKRASFQKSINDFAKQENAKKIKIAKLNRLKFENEKKSKLKKEKEEEQQQRLIKESQESKKYQSVYLSDEVKHHILNGDKTGGGHGHGRNIPGKSEFPSGWSDEKAIKSISEVAADPESKRSDGRSGRTLVRGTRDQVEIEVVVEPDGKIVTGYPTNVIRNEK